MPVLIGVAVLVVAVACVLTARTLSHFLDGLHTVPIAALPASPIGWNGAYLQFGSAVDGADGPKGGWNGHNLQSGAHILGLDGPAPHYRQAAAFQVDPGGLLIVSTGGRTLVLGPRAGALASGDGPVPAFAAQPGDRTSLTLERSLLSWPVFELNFMTGRSPSWRRGLYYRLAWTRRSGERLDMVWRFEQGFYPADGWSAPGGSGDDTGLVRADIRPAP